MENQFDEQGFRSLVAGAVAWLEQTAGGGSVRLF